MILRNWGIYFVECVVDFAIVCGAQYFIESCEGKPYGGEFAVQGGGVLFDGCVGFHIFCEQECGHVECFPEGTFWV